MRKTDRRPIASVCNFRTFDPSYFIPLCTCDRNGSPINRQLWNSLACNVIGIAIVHVFIECTNRLLQKVGTYMLTRLRSVYVIYLVYE